MMNSYASDVFAWHARMSPFLCREWGEAQIRSWNFSNRQGPPRFPSEAPAQQVLHAEDCRTQKIKRQHKPYQSPAQNLWRSCHALFLKSSVLHGRDYSDIGSNPEVAQSSERLFSHIDPISNREIREGEQVIKCTANAKIHPPATAEPEAEISLPWHAGSHDTEGRWCSASPEQAIQLQHLILLNHNERCLACLPRVPQSEILHTFTAGLLIFPPKTNNRSVSL